MQFNNQAEGRHSTPSSLLTDRRVAHAPSQPSRRRVPHSWRLCREWAFAHSANRIMQAALTGHRPEPSASATIITQPLPRTPEGRRQRMHPQRLRHRVENSPARTEAAPLGERQTRRVPPQIHRRRSGWWRNHPSRSDTIADRRTLVRTRNPSLTHSGPDLSALDRRF